MKEDVVLGQIGGKKNTRQFAPTEPLFLFIFFFKGTHHVLLWHCVATSLFVLRGSILLEFSLLFPSNPVSQLMALAAKKKTKQKRNC